MSGTRREWKSHLLTVSPRQEDRSGCELTFSDVVYDGAPCVEVYGSDGALSRLDVAAIHAALGFWLAKQPDAPRDRLVDALGSALCAGLNREPIRVADVIDASLALLRAELRAARGGDA